MKNLSKLLCVITICLSSFQSYSQIISGIKGGVNLAGMEWENESGFNFETTNTTGYHIGLQFEFILSDLFSVESGIFWSKKGAEIYSESYSSEINGYLSFNSEMEINYIDWPITLKVGVPIGNGRVKIYAVAGGFLNWGISGKWNLPGESIDIWSDDYGATFGAGIEINSIQISSSYDLGLADIGANKISISQSVIKVSVAYLFL
jgi:opacity protein-like surface antigen